MHLAVDAAGLPLRVLITEGAGADCALAGRLIEGIKAGHLIANKGYDTDALLSQAEAQGMTAVIPPKRSRKDQRRYGPALHKRRHRIENAFLHLKRWRGIATRYAKNSHSFLAAAHIRCLALWLGMS